MRGAQPAQPQKFSWLGNAVNRDFAASRLNINATNMNCAQNPPVATRSKPPLASSRGPLGSTTTLANKSKFVSPRTPRTQTQQQSTARSPQMSTSKFAVCGPFIKYCTCINTCILEYLFLLFLFLYSCGLGWSFGPPPFQVTDDSKPDPRSDERGELSDAHSRRSASGYAVPSADASCSVDEVEDSGSHFSPASANACGCRGQTGAEASSCCVSASSIKPRFERCRDLFSVRQARRSPPDHHATS